MRHRLPCAGTHATSEKNVSSVKLSYSVSTGVASVGTDSTQLLSNGPGVSSPALKGARAYRALKSW